MQHTSLEAHHKDRSKTFLTMFRCRRC